MVLSGSHNQLLSGSPAGPRPSNMENIMRKIAAVFTGTVATIVLLVAPVTSASAAPAHVACGGCWAVK